MGIEVVNGYVCRNCTDVEYAKKGVDPAHPKDGVQGADAAASAAKAEKADAPDARGAERGPAVTFGGGLAALQTAPAVQPQPAPYFPGATVSLTA